MELGRRLIGGLPHKGPDLGQESSSREGLKDGLPSGDDFKVFILLKSGNRRRRSTNDRRRKIAAAMEIAYGSGSYPFIFEIGEEDMKPHRQWRTKSCGQSAQFDQRVGYAYGELPLGALSFSFLFISFSARALATKTARTAVKPWRNINSLW